MGFKGTHPKHIQGLESPKTALSGPDRAAKHTSGSLKWIGSTKTKPENPGIGGTNLFQTLTDSNFLISTSDSRIIWTLNRSCGVGTEYKLRP